MRGARSTFGALGVVALLAAAGCGGDDAAVSPGTAPPNDAGGGGGDSAAAHDGATATDGGSGGDAGKTGDATTQGDGSTSDGATPPDGSTPDGGTSDGGTPDGSTGSDGGTPPDAGHDASAGGPTPTIAGCQMFPPNHIFNTPIDGLPTLGASGAFMGTIGSANIHLDLGTTVNPQSDTYYGIPYNVVHGGAITWTPVSYSSLDTSMTWNPRPEADCAIGAGHTLISPCIPATAAAPLLPFPANVLVEGGIYPDVDNQDYGDHHVIMLDADTCHLWEVFHAYTGASGAWDIFGSAYWDLGSNALRPSGWTSADAAGFPILPLLLRADEASTGHINHALRMTIPPGSIRQQFVWPARHLTETDQNAAHPPMGQLFRITSSYVIPAGYSVQSKAILQALKTYGVYLADGGSALYIQGEPSASWSSTILSQVQSVGSDQFEAVDLTPIHNRAGFSLNSGAVPP